MKVCNISGSTFFAAVLISSKNFVTDLLVFAKFFCCVSSKGSTSPILVSSVTRIFAAPVIAVTFFVK